jgi:chromosome segregation protein
VLRARELATARERSAALDAEEAAFAARLAELEERHDAAQADEGRLGDELAGLEPLVARAGEAAHRLETVRERLRGTVALAEERARHLAEALATEAEGRSAADLEREAAAVARELEAVEAELASTTAATRAAEAERDRARAALAAHDQAATRAERDRAGAHKREVRLASEVAGLERAIEQMEAEGGRLREQAELLGRRQAGQRAQLEKLRSDRAELERQQAGRAGDLTAAGERRDRQATATRRLAAEERRVEAERAAARARREAFEATARSAGGGALAFLEGAGRDGVLGPLAPALSVEPGYEAAVAAALGADADAIVVAGQDVATGGAALLRDAGSGRAILLHPNAGGGAPRTPPGRGPGLDGEPLLLDRVTTAGRAGEVARALLAGVLVAADLPEARTLLARHPDVTVVTRAGELLASGRVEGGVVPEASGLAARRAADEAAEAEAKAAATLARLTVELHTAQRDLGGDEAAADDAAKALRDAQAAVRRLDDRLALAGRELRGLEAEAAVAAERLHELDTGRERAAARLTDAEAELAAIKDGVGAARPPDADARPPLADALDRAEQATTAARVAGAAVGERRRLLQERLAELRAQAAAEVQAAERRAGVRAARLDGAARAREAAGAGRRALDRLGRSLDAVTAERDRLAGALLAARAGLAEAAARRREAAAALDEHHTATRASDTARVEARLRAEELGKRIIEEFAIDPDEALAEYLPDEARRAELPETDPRRQPSAELRRVATALDRRLTLLGRVNPLALEEFRALEERYTFLSGQLQDLKESRRDLLKVVRAVDERVREVFGQAFEDVAREFQRTFALLFPGGDGRLLLTDPEDLLDSGVEVEARPPGKRVRRLSLLSGGERSLVALAFYFAIFRARPSPFYVLDEVEAALDDVNLHRFLDLLDDTREQAQLLIVSHQRRTMEAGDALYGVSMQADGVSKVVSQRLRGGAPAEDAAAPTR